MKKRTFFNPVINDTATFIKTSEETNGEYSLVAIDLYKSDGPPLHYHKTFSENFEVIEGSIAVNTLKLSAAVKLPLLFQSG